MNIGHEILKRVLTQARKMLDPDEGVSVPGIVAGMPEAANVNLDAAEVKILNDLGGQQLKLIVLGNDRVENITEKERPALLITLGTYAVYRGLEGAIAERGQENSMNVTLGEEENVIPLSCKIVVSQMPATKLTLETSVPFLVMTFTSQLRYLLSANMLRSVKTTVPAAMTKAQVIDAEFVGGKFIEGENDSTVIYEVSFLIHYKFPKVRGV